MMLDDDRVSPLATATHQLHISQRYSLPKKKEKRYDKII